MFTTKTFFPVLIASILLSCASGTSPANSAAKVPPSNYAQIVSNGAPASIFRKKDARWPIEITHLRPGLPTEAGDWMVCMRILQPSSSLYYSVFLNETEVADWRPSVIIDRCELQNDYFRAPPPKSSKQTKDAVAQ
jgi:hypothetical protein